MKWVHTYTKSCGGHDGPGGEYRGERQVQRFDHGLSPRHLIFQLLVAAGDYDGIINVGAHLDGADDQIA